MGRELEELAPLIEIAQTYRGVGDQDERLRLSGLLVECTQSRLSRLLILALQQEVLAQPELQSGIVRQQLRSFFEQLRGLQRLAVSKDGRWLGLACGRPSRRAQSFEARAAPSGARALQDDVRAPSRRGLMRRYDSNLGNTVLGTITLQGASNPNVSPLESISPGLPLASYIVGFSKPINRLTRRLGRIIRGPSSANCNADLALVAPRAPLPAAQVNIAYRPKSADHKMQCAISDHINAMCS
jgi:hypothetical protein